MSAFQVFGVVCAGWTLGVFVASYIIGRFNLITNHDGESDPGDAVAISVFWPFAVLWVCSKAVFEFGTDRLEWLIEQPFKAGQKGRSKSENPSP